MVFFLFCLVCFISSRRRRVVIMFNPFYHPNTESNSRFPPCNKWTRRDTSLVLGPDSSCSYTLYDFIKFFREIDGHSSLDELAPNNEDSLELWQVNKRFDLVYYHMGERKLRLRLNKKEVYVPSRQFPENSASEKTIPMSKVEMIVLRDSLCINLLAQIEDEGGKGGFQF